MLVAILTREQRTGVGTIPTSLPTLIVARQHSMTNRTAGEGTVNSYNSSQLSCLKEYEGVEGVGWNVGGHQNNDIRSSHNRYSQERTERNARLITPSHWNNNTSLRTEQRGVGDTGWNNNTQYTDYYIDHQEIDMDNFAMVSLQRN